MMRRVLTTSVAALFLAIAAPSIAHAQASVFLMAGPTIPIGDFGDFAKTGWMGYAGVTFPLGENGLWAGVEGSYGQNSHDADVTFVDDGDKTNLIGAMGLLGYSIPTESSVQPYVWGGAGLLVHRFSPATGSSVSDSNFGFQAGAGVAIGEGSVKPLIEARIESAGSETQFIGVEVGALIDVGN